MACSSSIHQVGAYQYDMSHKLGSGGFGAVYKGQNVKTCQPVAVKVVPTRYYFLLIFLRTLINHFSKLRRQEIRAATELRHPNIITVLEIIEEVENTYMILEWCEHGDLLALVNMYEFSEKDAREVILQILPALEYSYHKGWAHLDVK